VSSFNLSASSRARFAPFIIGFALALSAGICAAQEKPNGPSEKAGEAFAKLKPLQESKNYDGMIAVLDALAPTVDPMS